MKTRAIATALLIAMAPITMSAPSFAQDDPLTQQARERFKEGVAFFDKGQFENARASFLQAYALKNHPAVLLNLAQSCLRANHPLEAIKYFQQYLRQVQSPTPQQRHDAETGLEEARSKVGHVDILAPAGTEVSIVGGERLGNAPFGEGVDLEPGTYTFKSRATDGSSDTAKVTVVAGTRQQAKLGSGASTPTPVPVPTTVPTTTPPVDNTPPPPADNTNPPPPPDNNPPPPPKKQGILAPPQNMIPVYAGGGAALVGFGLAITFGVLKGGAQNSANSVDATIRSTASSRGLSPTGICTSTSTAAKNFVDACATYTTDLNQVNQDATAANVFVAVGIIGLLAGAGWYLFAPKAGEAEGTHPSTPASSPMPQSMWLSVTPTVGFGNAGLSMTGRF